MMMESLRISCHVLSLFPFILEDATVTVYYCSWAHATNDAHIPVTSWTHMLASSFKDNIKAASTVFTFPPSSIYWEYWLYHTAHSTQHTTYKHWLSIRRRHARGLVSWVQCIPSMITLLISAIAHKYYITWVTLIHRCSATAKIWNV